MLGFADDILLISDSPIKLQKLIDVCYNWSVKNGMRFKISKCKVRKLNKGNLRVPYLLAGKPIVFVSEYKYFGVKLSYKRQASLITHYISAILEETVSDQEIA